MGSSRFGGLLVLHANGLFPACRPTCTLTVTLCASPTGLQRGGAGCACGRRHGGASDHHRLLRCACLWGWQWCMGASTLGLMQLQPSSAFALAAEVLATFAAGTVSHPPPARSPPCHAVQAAGRAAHHAGLRVSRQVASAGQRGGLRRLLPAQSVGLPGVGQQQD